MNPLTTFPSARRVTRHLLVSIALLNLAGIASATESRLPSYQPRFGRLHPIIAVVGENSGTELTDFAIPYGILKASGAAEVFAVSTQPGKLRLRPALSVQPDSTTAEFDARFPDGADYVIVPAVMKYNDPTLLTWLKEQGAKGATLMSICDGAAVVAGTGLMDGHRATGHWASEKVRRKKFPRVDWIADVRYVSDGKIISTAGISAALPASLALVEAIAGRERAAAVAAELGISDWSATHRTAPFRPRFGVNLKALITANYSNHWFHRTEMLGLRLAPGVDEISLAITADAYSRTGRSMVHALAATAEPIRSRHGLLIVPDSLAGGTHHMDRMLPDLDQTPSGQSLAKSLEGIKLLYGRTTADGVALDFEYPMPVPSITKVASQK